MISFRRIVMISVALLFLAGLLLICIGGDKLVDAAVNISGAFGIPQIVVGATIISICTTLPEILVSTTAVIDGSAAIAVGNAFGSIICNTGLIAGIAFLFSPSRQYARRDILWRFVFFFVIITGMIICGTVFGRFGTPVGITLLVLFAVYAVLSIYFAGNDRSPASGPGSAGASSIPRDIVILVICAVFLFVGARLLVDNGIIMAEYFGIPERVIGVTAIALGTSLPELITTTASLIKKHSGIGIGNVIGANLLNILLVIGIPSAFAVIPLEAGTIYVDMPLAAAVMLILALPILIRQKSSRVQGVILLSVYLIYCIVML